MKKGLLFLGVLFIGGVIAFSTGCEEDPEESCQQDEICTLENGEMGTVTACCTDGEDCYFTYNGKKYPDTDEGVADLIKDLGCVSLTKKSTKPENGYDYVKARLESLLEEARIFSMN